MTGRSGGLRYKIISAVDSGVLEHRVNECIEAGFEPLGAPTATGEFHGRLIQAMVQKPNTFISAAQRADDGAVGRKEG